jgi:endoglycosylceramidase
MDARRKQTVDKMTLHSASTSSGPFFSGLCPAGPKAACPRTVLSLALLAGVLAAAACGDDSDDDDGATETTQTAETTGTATDTGTTAGTTTGDAAADTGTAGDSDTGATAGDSDTGTDTGEAPLPYGLGFVRADGGRLVDTFGREVVPHGVNARIEGLFDVVFDDGRQRLQPLPEFTEDDAVLMAKLGFSFLRLPINWSGLEPVEGQFSESYLAQLDAVIAACRKHGLYVLVDFHQDAYSKEIGEDGAPLWAILPKPAQLLEGPLDDLEQRRLSRPVLDAYSSFFNNTRKLRDRFMPVWQLVTARYASEDAVIGFELMNEPVAFHVTGGIALLEDFTRQGHAAMREVNDRHAFWFEPDSLRNFSFKAAAPTAPLGDTNSVYAPHIYPRNSGLTTEADWQTAVGDGLTDTRAEADAWGSALFLGEWGADPKSAASRGYIQFITNSMDAVCAGHAVWLWKEISQGFWGFFDRSDDAAAAGTPSEWTLREAFAREAIRPYPLAVPGKLDSLSFDDATGTLTVAFTATGGETAGPVLVLPKAWFAGGAAATLNGATVTLQPTGIESRFAVPWTLGTTGAFTLITSP